MRVIPERKIIRVDTSAGWFVVLCDVVVLLRVVLVAFHVVPVDEGLDALLEVGRLHREAEVREELVEEQRVAQSLAHLHDADDGGVDLVLAVLEMKESALID